jgi:hypothetical protein
MPTSGGSTQTVQNKNPWAPTQPHLKEIMAEGGRLYDQGAGSGIYQGPTLAPLGQDTQQGMSLMGDTARANAGATGLPMDAALNSIANNGMTPDMAGPTSVLGNVAGGQSRINTGGMYGALAGRSLNQNNQPNNVLGGIAGGNANNNQSVGLLGSVASGPGIDASGYADIGNRALTQNAQPNSTMAGLLGNQIGQINTGDQYRSVANNAGGATASDQLSGMVAGGGVNPHLQSMLDANAERIANRVNSSMSGMGRYGSGSHTDLLARSIGEANNPLLAQAYESDQNRRLSAAGQIDSSRRAADATQLNAISGQTGVQGQNIANQLSNSGLQLNAANTLASGNRADLAGSLSALQGGSNVQQQNISNLMGAATGMAGIRQGDTSAQMGAANALASGNRADVAGSLSALSGLTGVQGQNIANQTGAASSLLDNSARGQQQAQQWAALAPTLNQLQYDPATRLMTLGAMSDQRSQAELDAERQRFEAEQASPWNQLNRYQASVSGLGGLLQGMGTSTGTQQSEAGLMDYLKLFAGGGNSSAAGMANGASAILGLLSDRNEKTDIKKVGTDSDTGLDLYSYRYKGDPKTYPKVVGPMAQDIEKNYPGSTVRISGKLAVRPEAAGLLGAL